MSTSRDSEPRQELRADRRTASILLNVGVAPRTWLGVGLHPLLILLLVAVLDGGCKLLASHIGMPLPHETPTACSDSLPIMVCAVLT